MNKLNLFALAISASIAPITAAALPVPDHVVIVIEENHSEQSIIGNTDAAWINYLASSGANFSSFYAITHPSQPNYLQFFSGSNQGVNDDTTPASGVPFTTSNLGAALRTVGASFAGYSEDLPSIGAPDSVSGNYVRKHNPWVNWQKDISPTANQLPSSVNLPFTSFPTDDVGFAALPKVSIVVPNLQHDMHDGTIAQADTWLAQHMDAYKTWASAHNSLLAVTFDEDEHAQHNKIPTILYGPMVKNIQNDQTWTLHNLLRTVEDMYGAAHSGNAAKVTPITGIWTNESQTPTTVAFRRGLNLYDGVSDTYLDASASSSLGAANPVVVDGSPVNQGLIKFDKLRQSAGGTIPDGAQITAATLTIITGASTATNDQSLTSTELHRMLAPWNESSTWASMVNGISLDNAEASTTVDAAATPNQVDAAVNFDVTGTVQAWINGQANFGWALMPLGTDGWRWNSSEAGIDELRPTLTVSYVLPEPPGMIFLGLGGMFMGRRMSMRVRRTVARTKA